jgi:hypothetical protein
MWNTVIKSNPYAAVASAALAVGAALGSFLKGNKVKKANEEIEAQQDLLDSLEHTYERLQDKADKLFGSNYVNNYNEQLANLQKQQKAYLKQLQAERNKGKDADEDKIDEYEDKIQELADEISDMQNAVAEKFLGADIASAARDFAQAWIEAYSEFSSTADAMSDKFQEMLENMVVESVLGQVMERALQPVFDMVNNINDFYDYQTWSDVAGLMQTAVKNATYGAQTIAGFLEDAGINLRSTSSDLTGYSREIATASEESITGLTVATNTQNVYLSHVPNIDANVAIIANVLQNGNANNANNVDMAATLSLQTSYLSSLPAIAASSQIAAEQAKSAATSCKNLVDNFKRVIVTKGNSYAIKVS